MNDWLHDLPVIWTAIIVFGGTAIVSAAIYGTVISLARGDWARAFKGVSPGMLPPVGILFGLFVAFTAAQVWSDNDRAAMAVNREASALSEAVFMASSFPDAPKAQLRGLVHDYIQEVATQEWPEMAQQSAHLRVTPQPLLQALQADLAIVPAGPAQQTAQREFASALENALDARRQRIQVSKSEVNPVKWSCLLLQAFAMLVTIAMVHSDNRRTAAIAMSLFGVGVAISILIIVAHDRPFAGDLAIGPSALLHVMPESVQS